MKYTASLVGLSLLTSLTHAQEPTKQIAQGFKKLAPDATIKLSKKTLSRVLNK